MRNFFNNLFFYLLFLGIGTNVLTSCKEEVESISELSLEQTKIQIKEGETVTVKIIGGSGNYQISLSDVPTEKKHRTTLWVALLLDLTLAQADFDRRPSVVA